MYNKTTKMLSEYCFLLKMPVSSAEIYGVIRHEQPNSHRRFTRIIQHPGPTKRRKLLVLKCTTRPFPHLRLLPEYSLWDLRRNGKTDRFTSPRRAQTRAQLRSIPPAYANKRSVDNCCYLYSNIAVSVWNVPINYRTWID